MIYNDPEIAFITAFTAAVKTATGLDVYEKEPDTVTYPHIYSTIEVTNTSNKNEFYYNIDVNLQVIDRDTESLSNIVAAKNNIVSLVNHGEVFTVTGYAMLNSELINTTRIEREIDNHKYNIQIVRLNYELQNL